MLHTYAVQRVQEKAKISYFPQLNVKRHAPTALLPAFPYLSVSFGRRVRNETGNSIAPGRTNDGVTRNVPSGARAISVN